MKVGIPKEIYPHECRVAATPDTVEKMVKLGLEVVVEAGAGDASSFADAAYIEAGAKITGASGVYAEADIVLKVRQPIARSGGAHEADELKPGTILISFLWPAQNKALVDRLAARKVTVFAMDAVPRITRAQKLDALSAMANIAGYRAVVEAAHHFGRFFSGQVTAAGRVKPAQVLILGAGVAGLAAIAAARGLGAVVKAFDTRPVVREQVESLGAQFVEFKFEEAGEGAGGYAKQMSDAYLAAEQALIAKHAQASDIIISTALIPGKPAPVLITPGAVTAMAQGSVIVDMAAEQGGNCPLTEKDKVVEKSGVTLIGLTDLPSRMARQSSELYATTVLNLLKEMYTAEKGLVIDLKDEIQRGAVVLKDGELLWPAPAPAAAPAAAAKPAVAGNNAHGAAPGAANNVEKEEQQRQHRRGAGGDPAGRSRDLRTARVHPAPDRVPAGLRGRLAHHLERDAGAAHAAHERDQRDQRHHRHRRHAGPLQQRSGGDGAGRRRRPDRCDQRRGRLPRHATHAEDVPEVTVKAR